MLFRLCASFWYPDYTAALYAAIMRWSFMNAAIVIISHSDCYSTQQ